MLRSELNPQLPSKTKKETKEFSLNGFYEETGKALRDCCENDLERVRFLLETVFNDEDTMEHYYTKYIYKNETLAKEKREEGNTLFKSGSYHDALESYNESISISPANAECLALSYANRALTLKSLERYKDCITDTNRAIQKNYPSNQIHKLHLRLGQCYQNLNDINNAIKHYNIALGLSENNPLIEEKFRDTVKKGLDECKKETGVAPKIKEKKRHIPKIPKISNKNSVIPVASDCIDIKTDETGTYIVAKTDILPGVLITVEPVPFGNVFKCARFLHCSHCCKISRALIPCDNCIWMLYCSEECKNDSKSYHEWECCKAPPTLMAKSDSHLKIIIRILSKLGIDNIIEYMKTKYGKEDDLEEVCNSDGKIISTDISSLLRYSKMYLNESEPLKFYEHYFKIAKILKVLNLIDHMECLIPFLDKILRIPRFAMFLGHETMGYNKWLVEQFGEFISPIFFMFSYSCNPNALYYFHGDNMVVRAVSYIPEGSKITLCHTMNYFFNMRQCERQSSLKNNFGLDCKCDACLNNYPIMEFLPQTIEFQFPKETKLFLINSANVNQADLNHRNKYVAIPDEHIMPFILRFMWTLSKYGKLNRSYCEFFNEINKYYIFQGTRYLGQLF